MTRHSKKAGIFLQSGKFLFSETPQQAPPKEKSL